MNRRNVKRESMTELQGAGIFDSLLSSIADRVWDGSTSIPSKLFPYLAGEKQAQTEEEGEGVRRLYERWIEDTLRALERKPKTAENLQEFLKVLPEPFKSDVIRALEESIVEA